MIKVKTILLTLITVLFLFQTPYAEPINENDQNSESINENNQDYKKLEDLKRELKEERKVIDQQRLEQIKLKELEKNKDKNDTEVTPDTTNSKENKTPKKTQDNIVPSLIVRLRGKHSTKYLCEYNFTVKNNNTENSVSNVMIEDYNTLLKKPSLKVRPGETINLEFSRKPEKLTTYIYGENNNEEISLKKGSFKVPTLDKKIILIIEGTYDNGYVKYAIVLDIRN